MQHPDPAEGTSLELSSEPDVDPPVSSATDVPTPGPERLQTPDLRAEPTPGPLGDLVVAHFRRVEIAMLGRVLITTLGGALPPSMVTLERRRSLAQRLSGRAGEPIGITISAGDRLLSFRAPELGVAEAAIGHTVRGVVLSTRPVTVVEWLDELAELLDHVTSEDEAIRAALERTLLS